MTGDALHRLTREFCRSARLPRDLCDEVGVRRNEDNSFFISADRLFGQRAVSTASGSGATLVGEQNIGGVVDYLREDSVLLGKCTVHSGLKGDYAIVEATGKSPASTQAEDADTPLNDVVFDSTEGAPRTISGAVQLTRRLVQQSNPSVTDYLQRAVRRSVILELENQIVGADGADEIPSIATRTGLNALPNTADLTDMREAIESDGEIRDSDRLCYVASPATLKGYRALKTQTALIATTDRWDMLGGVDVVRKTLTNGAFGNATGNYRLLLGDMSRAHVLIWDDVEVVLDTATDIAKGRVTVRSFLDADLIILKPQAFAVMTA